MTSEERRKNILKQIELTTEPLSATKLAKTFSVSRQSIVGDVALLRATGVPIIATARGYILEQTLKQGRYLQKIVCQHCALETADELTTIVELGGEILDVIVEHELYGEITGQLNIATPQAIQDFLTAQKNAGAKYLSELTGGIHTHTIATKTREDFETVQSALFHKGYLYGEN